MSFSENTSDSDWKEAKKKVARHIKRASSNSNKNSNNSGVVAGKQKYSQKFCEKWLNLFDPWLSRCADDADKPFCRACQCRLDCNRCHLLRHERTTKHKRNLEALITKGEGAARKGLCVRQERSKYYHQRKRAIQLLKEEPAANEEEEEPVADSYEELVTATVDGAPEANITDSSAQHFHMIQAKTNDTLMEAETKPEAIIQASLPAETFVKVPPKPSSPPNRSSASSKEGLKRLMQIHQDKNELMESFRELMTGHINHAPPAKEKNHVDLFFESVSSSVKALSPNLIAEAKMRVSQVICELELRGLKDNSTSEGIALPITPQGNNAFMLKQSISGQSHFGALS